MCWVRVLPSCGGYNVVTVQCNAGLHCSDDWRVGSGKTGTNPASQTSPSSQPSSVSLSQPRTTGAERQQIGLLHRYAFSVHFSNAWQFDLIQDSSKKVPILLQDQSYMFIVYYSNMFYNFIEVLPLMCWVYSLQYLHTFWSRICFKHCTS